MNKSKNATVLVVDDEAANLDILFEHLRKANFRVLVAEDGASALERVKHLPPDIALLDVNLPDIDGFELCRRLKEEKAIADIPIMFLTVKEEVADKVKAFEMSAVDYITKPFVPEEVVARVKKHLTIHELRKQLEVQNTQLQQVISERYQMQKALDESDERFKLLVESSFDVLYAVATDGIIEYISPQIAQFGYSQEDVIGKNVTQFIAPEQREEAWHAFQTLIRTDGNMPVQFQWLGKDGSPHWVEVYDKNVYDDSGQAVQRVGVMRNITERLQVQEALRESEERFRVLVEKTHDLVYSINLDGVFTYVSPQVAQFGHIAEEWIGKSISDFLNPEEREEIMLLFRQRVISGDTSPATLRWLRKDGSYDWVEVSAKNVYDASGQAVQRVGVMRNITERMQMQEALRESEERFRALVENSHDAVYAIGIDGIIDYISPQIALFGSAQEDVIGKNVIQFIAPEQREETWQGFQTQLRTGGTNPAQFQWLSKDGSRVWVEVSARNVFDDSGQLIQRVGIMRDVSDRKQVEEALRESNSRLASIIESAMDAIITINEEQIVVMFNPAAEDMFGYSQAEIVGRPLSKLMPDRYKMGHTDHVQAFGQTSVTNRRITTLGSLVGRRANGEEFPIEVAISQIMSSGQKLYTAITRDITERKRAEKQLEEAVVSAERERIARDLHDAVTQSLFMASSIAETLPQIWERKPDEARRGVDELRWLTMGALAEMRNMLIELHPTALTERTLGVLLKQLTDGLMARTQMPVTISVAGDCSLPDEVQIALYRIAQEALNNIIKHALASRAILRLDCTPERVQFSIQDNGEGFDPGAIGSDHMGVSNMSERAQAIGAEFRLDSEPGQGTKIAVTWRQ